MANRHLACWATIAVLALAGTSQAVAFEVPLDFGTSQRPARIAPQRGYQQPPVVLAQEQAGQSLVRLNQLEDEVRKLNGKIENLSFQLLQMQEQIRKQQEDNEFRFQDLEKGGSGGKRTEATPPPAADRSSPAPSAAGRDVAAATPDRGADKPALSDAQGDQIGQILSSGSGTGAPPAPLGSTKSSDVASISPKDQGDLYVQAYNYILSGDYKRAEDAFRQYTQTYPNANDVADAQYWLGESLFQQKKYTDAAETFLNAQKQHPDSKKAPEMMLKLGMSLAKLDNRDTACVTFSEVARRYPSMSASVKRKLDEEKKASSC